MGATYEATPTNRAYSVCSVLREGKPRLLEQPRPVPRAECYEIFFYSQANLPTRTRRQAGSDQLESLPEKNESSFQIRNHDRQQFSRLHAIQVAQQQYLWSSCFNPFSRCTATSFHGDNTITMWWMVDLTPCHCLCLPAGMDFCTNARKPSQRVLSS